MAPSLNISERFLSDRVREGRGDRVALRLGARTLTYGEVDRLADAYAAALLGMDVRPEERVIVALPDGAAYVGALFGILRVGAVAVMVNPALPEAGLASIVERSRARVAVTDAAGATVPVSRPLTVTGDGPAPAGAVPPVATHPDDPAIWLFSGGTTGEPKIAVQTHASFANTTELYARRTMGWHEDDVTMSVPKLFFGYATGANLLFPFSVGASAVLFPEHPTPDVVFDRIDEHRPTILVNVPKMVADMVDHPRAASADLSCLRFATSAGEALPPSLYQRWTETFGVPLYDGLGTAEMWHIFVSNQPGAVRPGTLGRAVPGFDVEVRDAAGVPVPDGDVGRLWVRGGSRASGYWRNAEASADTFRGEWVVLGDLVRRDPDGFISYVGRSDDALKVGGKWLLPAEVEDCLLAHPAVAEAAVVGVPDAGGLAKPVAFVVVAADRAAPDEETLRRHCLDRLEPYKHPRRVFVIEAMPRTHLGKADRGALRRLAGTPEPSHER